METNIVYHGDWRSVIEGIPSGSIDLVLTDPPYNVTASEWDRDFDIGLFWKHLRRIGSSTCTYAIFSAQPFTTRLISSNLKEFKYCWYWIKNQGTNFFHAKRMPIRKVEEICVFYKNKNTYNPQMSEGHVPTNSAIGSHPGRVYYGRNKRNYAGGSTQRFPTNVLEYNCVDNYSRVHPNEKPVELLSFLINTYTDKGDVVFDPFSGSGSTLVAARNLNRKYIGVELMEEYVKVIHNRLSVPHTPAMFD